MYTLDRDTSVSFLYEHKQNVPVNKNDLLTLPTHSSPSSRGRITPVPSETRPRTALGSAVARTVRAPGDVS